MMRTLVRAGWLSALMILASCDGDASDAQKASQQSAVTTAGQSITLTTGADGLVQQQTPKGVKVELGDHFQSAAIARRNADGSITTECHDEQQSAEAFMNGGAAAGEVK